MGGSAMGGVSLWAKAGATANAARIKTASKIMIVKRVLGFMDRSPFYPHYGDLPYYTQ
jgi:hypothetical protein